MTRFNRRQRRDRYFSEEKWPLLCQPAVRYLIITNQLRKGTEQGRTLFRPPYKTDH